MTQGIDRTKAQQLAEAVAEAFYAADHAARGLGIQLLEVRPGYARMTMTVRQDMVNSHGTCHGGFSYALADTAFAYACNSHNHATVAAACNIVYPAAAHLGDVLTAVAEEKHRAGRNGLTDVVITNQAGTVIALFRGQSRRVEGKIVEGS